jgi:hypothetical protein
MKTLDIQYRQPQSVNIDLGMPDIASFSSNFRAESESFSAEYRSLKTGPDDLSLRSAI